MIKFKRRPPVEINSSSMADIAFLLLIFFLVTTTISMDEGINIVLPAGESTTKVRESDLTKIIVDNDGGAIFQPPGAAKTLLTVNELHRIKSLTEGQLIQNKQMIFSVDVTNKSEYSNYVKVLDYLKQGNAKKIAIVN
jgi:biopolymer transport protein ExbD|tara:strand:+ start:124 stop:537 length:414 start_codon:yes stop_codon:yes gene_type:complete